MISMGAMTEAAVMPGWGAHVHGTGGNSASPLPVTEPDGVIHAVFRERAHATPDRPAVVGPDRRQLSYADLDRAADAIAAQLLESGIGPETPVGLLADSTPECIAAALAIVRCGAACVPIDRQWPPARVAAVADASGMAAAVVPAHAHHRADQLPAGLPRLAVTGRTTSRTAVRTPNTHPENLAYILFTSGTTGTPKAVGITHQAVVNLVRHATFTPIGPWTVTAQVASPAFDASLLEIWGPLLNGGTCVTIGDDFPDPRMLRRLVRIGGVNTLLLTTSVFNACADADPGALTGLEWLFVAGEAFSAEHGHRVAGPLSQTRIYNGYGPTECTCFATVHHVRPEDLSASLPVPIGTPVQNLVTRVLDEHGRTVDPGDVGDLHVGGLGLARGYLNDVRLTAERFVPDPAGPRGGRIYRTGDRVRIRHDRVLEFRGRHDRQVKIRGNRVECDEIEACLRAVPGIAACAVLPRSDDAGAISLLAWVTTGPGSELTVPTIRAELARRLPPAAIPRHVRIIEALPLTSTGKIDYRALATG